MGLFHRLLRKPFFGRFDVPWRWPRGSDERAWERVRFSGGGASLVGVWGAAVGESAGVLVLAHPMGKAAKGHWLRPGPGGRPSPAGLFRSAGFDVLAFDANGFGESPAVSFDYPSGVLAAGLWAQGRRPGLPVGLVGASFGAAWGLCAMARAGSPFRAAVLEAVFPTLPEFWRHYPAAYATLRASQVVWPRLERGLRPEREAARVVGRPDVLLVYGDADRFTPPAFGRRLAAALDGRSHADLAVLPGVGHATAYRDAPALYADLVVPFLRRSLVR